MKRHKPGERRPRLCDEAHAYLQEGLASKHATVASMAEALGMTPRHLRRLARQMGLGRKASAKTGPKGPLSGGRLRTNGLKAEIYRMRDQGASQAAIAEALHITQPAVQYHLAGRRRLQEARAAVSKKRVKKKGG